MRRRAPCAPVWAFGTIPTARDMPAACFARWYTWLRPEAASLELSRWRSAGHLGAISTSATASHRSPCFGTIRLWYDIAVFVAVLSFHSARYRSDYGPRRPFEARVISARSRPRLQGLRHTDHPVRCLGTIRLWYDITVFAAVLSFHCARYRSCDVKTACMLSYICEIPAIYTTSYTATI